MRNEREDGVPVQRCRRGVACGVNQYNIIEEERRDGGLRGLQISGKAYYTEALRGVPFLRLRRLRIRCDIHLEDPTPPSARPAAPNNLHALPLRIEP